MSWAQARFSVPARPPLPLLRDGLDAAEPSSALLATRRGLISQRTNKVGVLGWSRPVRSVLMDVRADPGSASVGCWARSQVGLLHRGGQHWVTRPPLARIARRSSRRIAISCCAGCSGYPRPAATFSGCATHLDAAMCKRGWQQYGRAHSKQRRRRGEGRVSASPSERETERDLCRSGAGLARPDDDHHSHGYSIRRQRWALAPSRSCLGQSDVNTLCAPRATGYRP
ncbi:hypothetical protein L228DRAFT_268029 [Xylona heveae TC161]|uniref:Uncharacterized protein n=1 Tax=Xylona heveae (strain CBS 132557 / TC161) TaxID=1328760 RepID=A0A165GVC1_XYLHT|nr:hypothetical protein L228DRAFT_268029 [Xylona heveae TC161]KZF22640.1 hypothetical protein L228DRAFT_268029 [Xylona heveae TC161]